MQNVTYCFALFNLCVDEIRKCSRRSYVYRFKRRKIEEKHIVIFVVFSFVYLFLFCTRSFFFFLTFLLLGWRRAKRLTFTSILAYVIENRIAIFIFSNSPKRLN